MKSHYAAIIISLICYSQFSYGKEFGVGVILGGPTGISLEKKLDDVNSFDAALEYSTADESMRIHTTYLTRTPMEVKVNEVDFDWYWGLGAGLWTDAQNKESEKIDDDDEFGAFARASLGGNFKFTNFNLQAFGEASINADVVPQTDVMINLAIGARTYF